MEIETINYELASIQNKLIIINKKIKTVSNNKTNYENIVFHNKSVFDKILNTWTKGAMYKQISNQRFKLLHQEKNILHKFENEIENLKHEKRYLEDKESNLFYLKKSILISGGNNSGA